MRRKANVGRLVNTQRVFGGIDVDTNMVFLLLFDRGMLRLCCQFCGFTFARYVA